MSVYDEKILTELFIMVNSVQSGFTLKQQNVLCQLSLYTIHFR